MSVLLLSIGILVSLIGLFAIGFSIPIHEFSLGNTLMIAGTVAIVGGLIIVALSAAVRELRKVARLLEHPRVIRPPPPEAVPPGRRPPAPAEVPPKSAAPPKPQRPPKPRVEPPPVAEMPLPSERPAERPRPDIFAVTRAASEAAVTKTEDQPPLPYGAPRVPAPAAPPIAAEESPQAPEGPSELPPPRQLPPEAPPAPRPPPPAAMPRPPAPPPRSRFDTVWPTESIPTPRAVLEAAAKRAREEGERMPDLPQFPSREAVPPRPESEVRPVSILKSGVVDGMAYTLYTDGSIEAQLPQGIVRFASIDELRAHLEKHG